MGATAVAETEPESEKSSGLPAHLKPFTKETAAAAGRKSAEVRRQKAALRRAEQKRSSEALRAIIGQYERGDLPDVAVALAQDIMRKVATGEIPVRNGAEAAALLDKLHTIYRLETGQSTAQSLNVNVSASDALEALRGARTVRDVTGDEVTGDQ